MLDTPTRHKSRWWRPHRPEPVGTITARDLQILRYLKRYPFLDTPHLLMLAGGKNVDALNTRLRELAYAHLINKPPEQRNLINALSRPLIFELDKLGQKILDTHDIEEEAGISTSRAWFAHSVMICNVVANIEAGATKHRIKLTLVPKARYAVGQKQFLYPDAVFTLTYPDGKTLRFALECDTKSERLTKTADDRQTTYADKLENYKIALNSDVEPFWICHVTTTETRMENLKTLCGKSKYNMFNVHPKPGDHTISEVGKVDLILPPADGSMFGSWARNGYDPFVM